MNGYIYLERAKAQVAHTEEIKNSRIGGLGGSDAALVYSIGRNGMSTLSVTDIKRLAVMVGNAEPSHWGGNAYTLAGHAFEEYVSDKIFNNSIEREKVLEKELAKNFKVFAHADFFDNGKVYECKYVQKFADEVIETYYAQLQWYYMLGAEKVILIHGRGCADPFDVETDDLIDIKKDEQYIATLEAGIKILDEALNEGWQPCPAEKATIEDLPKSVQDAYEAYEVAKKMCDSWKEKADAAATTLLEFIEAFDFTGIVAENSSIAYQKEGTTRKFDTKKLFKEHPELNDEKYYTTSKRSSCIKFNIKK